MIAISAAIIGFGAVAISSSAFKSICQVRASTRIGSRAAKSSPRTRSSGPTVGSSAASGASFTIETQCATSARSRSTAAGSAPAAYCAGQLGERRPRVAGHHRLEEVEHPSAVGEPQHGAHLDGGRRAGAMRDRLIEQRQPVAHRALGGAHDQRQRVRRDRDPLLRGDAGEVRQHRLRLDPAEVEALAARQHRDRHLADLGGREDELHVRRRLLERLQQRVERRGARACALRR